MIKKKFQDWAEYNPDEKTAISVRDGVLEYLGAELGLEPSGKIFKVYRSPATISNAAMNMYGLPVVDEHISLDSPRPVIEDVVIDAHMIDYVDPATNTKLAVKNKLRLRGKIKDVLKNKRQLSLGYFADLVEHHEYDFEQINIVPHHLAIVGNGRCGELCSFIDRNFIQKEQSMTHKAFCDEDGEINLESVVEIVMALPEIIKVLPLERVNEIMPYLKQIVEEGTIKEPEPEPSESETESSPESEPDMPQEDEDMREDEEEKKPEFSDKKFEDAVTIKAKKLVDQAVKTYSEVVDKARHFLSDTYDFKNKKANQIMRDAIATQSNSQFTDEELPVAFKMLKKTSNYQNFGVEQEHPLDKIADKEL